MKSEVGIGNLEGGMRKLEFKNRNAEGGKKDVDGAQSTKIKAITQRFSKPVGEYRSFAGGKQHLNSEGI